MKSSCMEKMNNDKLTFNMNHIYMYKIMGQMKVLQVEWCEFIGWAKKGFH